MSEIDDVLILVAGGVNPPKSGGESPCLHGSKRDTAALTAMLYRIAPTPRQGCASPGCIRPQPALDPATGQFLANLPQHFLCPKKTLRQIYADFDRRSQYSRCEHVLIRKEKEKPVGRDHIKGIEGFWSYAKNWLYPYRGVPRKYFHLYLGDVCYRFNHRDEELKPLLGYKGQIDHFQ